MARHLKRTVTSHLQVLTQENGARTTRWENPPGGKSVCEIQTTPRPWQFKDIPDERNLLRPPPHWHWYQDEYFEIKQGRYIFTLESTNITASPSTGTVTIPARARHTFKADPSCSTPCSLVITASTSPNNNDGVSERYFRNIYSYRDDCVAQSIPPSKFQLLLMMHAAQISLAWPGPAWLMRWLSWGYGLLIGRVIGGWVLGYEESYREYNNEERAKKRA